MKHKIGILIVTIGILLGTTAIAGVNNPISYAPRGTGEMTTRSRELVSFTFPSLQYGRDGDYVTVHSESLHYTSSAGLPQLPYAVSTLTFPAGTIIDDVITHTSDVRETKLDGSIAPVPRPVQLNMQAATLVREKGPVYDSDKLYPLSWVTWQTGVGLHKGQHTLFLAIHAYPMQYNPVTNFVRYVDSIEVSVHYSLPTANLNEADVHDLLIISPDDFIEALQPLVDHKTFHGMSTMLVTLTDIYAGTYFPVEGSDEPEQIKYFIKNAVEGWGVTYVLLVGGMRGQQFAWYLPVRYTNNHAGSPFEEGFISDLYYADLYKYEGDTIIFADL